MVKSSQSAPGDTLFSCHALNPQPAKSLQIAKCQAAPAKGTLLAAAGGSAGAPSHLAGLPSDLFASLGSLGEGMYGERTVLRGQASAAAA